MRLIGKERLSPLRGTDKDVDLWISAWIAELSNAIWKCSDDLIRSFPRAQQCTRVVFIFPIQESGNSIKLLLSFDKGIALIQEVIKND